MATWRSVCGILASAIGIVGCSGGTTDAVDEPADIDIEPIIGGTPASNYPEGAYLNIDMANGSGYACSAALIAPKVVLTAGHCVDGHTKFEVYVGGSYRLSRSAATYDWVNEPSTYVNPNHHDIGLVFLNTPITLASYPQLSDSKLAEGTRITNVGRVLDGTVLWSLYQASTTAYGADSVGYPYDYVSTDLIQPGDSGGPVFIAGTHTIAAVNSGAGSGIQVLARVDLLASWIRGQIAAHGGTGSEASACDGADRCTDAAPDATGPDARASSPPAEGGASVPSNDAGTPPPSTDSGTDSAAPPWEAGSASPGADAGTQSPPADSGTSATADAGTSPSPPSQDAGPSDAGPTCTPEREPNNAYEAAMQLGRNVCGSVSPGTDSDWYYYDANVGVHVLRVTSSQDATMRIGIASGDTCMSAVDGLRSAKVKVFNGTQRLCVRIDSPQRRAQLYQLTAD